MPSAKRVLVRFRLPSPNTEWSKLHWCQIDTVNPQVPVLVAEVNMDGAMPDDRAFAPLPPEEARKLLVIGFVEPHSSLVGARAISSDTNGDTEYWITKSCIVMYEQLRYKFDFTIHNVLTPTGMCLGDEQSTTSKKAREMFTVAEIETDARLAMQSQRTNDFTLLDCSSEQLSILQQQYKNWEVALRHEEELRRQALIAEQIEEQQRQQQIVYQQNRAQLALKEWQQTPCFFEPSQFTRPQLSEYDQIILHPLICESLSNIKIHCSGPEEYASILVQLMIQDQSSTQFSAALIGAKRRFMEDYLTNGGTLRALFENESSSHPRFSVIYHYVLDVVFSELQIMDPTYASLSADDIKRPCPASEADAPLGVARRICLLDSEYPDPIDDQQLAYELQLREIMDNQQNPLAILQSPNQPIPGGGEPQPQPRVNGLPIPHQLPGRGPGLFNRPPRRIRPVNNLTLILGAAVAWIGIYLLVTNFSIFSLLIALTAALALGSVVYQFDEPDSQNNAMRLR